MKIYLYIIRNENNKSLVEIIRLSKSNTSIDIKTPDGFWDKIETYKTPEECNQVYNALVKYINYEMKRTSKDFVQVTYNIEKKTINNVPISKIQNKEQVQMTL